MKKYIKWIFLIIFVIAVIITILLFVNFAKNTDLGTNNDGNNANVSDNDNTAISKIYNLRWIRTGMSVYENEELTYEYLNFASDRYMVFSEDYVQYCYTSTEVCEDYKYQYNRDDRTIFIDSEDYFVVNGTYEIVLHENSFDLIMPVNETGKVIYYFNLP